MRRRMLMTMGKKTMNMVEKRILCLLLQVIVLITLIEFPSKHLRSCSSSYTKCLTFPCTMESVVQKNLITG